MLWELTYWLSFIVAFFRQIKVKPTFFGFTILGFTIAVYDAANQSGVDSFPVSLAVDQFKNSIGDLCVESFEQVVPPCHQC